MAKGRRSKEQAAIDSFNALVELCEQKSVMKKIGKLQPNDLLSLFLTAKGFKEPYSLPLFYSNTIEDFLSESIRYLNDLQSLVPYQNNNKLIRKIKSKNNGN